MRLMMLSAGIVALTLSAAVGAQAVKNMETMEKMEKASTDASMTYTGCVVSVNHDAMFLLTSAVETSVMPMNNQAMTHDEPMPMNNHAMTHDEPMRMEPAPTEHAAMDAMPSKSLVLTGADVKAHVGEKVAVTGVVSKASMGAMSSGLATFAVTSLKVVAKSCPQAAAR